MIFTVYLQHTSNDMNRIIAFFKKHKGKVNKYYLTLGIFAVFTFFIGDSTLYQRYLYDKKISDLNAEIRKYQKEIDENKTKLKSLRMDNESLERFAREQFLMTEPDEELYIITP